MGKGVLFCVVMVTSLPGLASGGGAGELVLNPKFEAVQASKLPEGWVVWGPVWEKAACRVRADAGGGLLVDGADPFAVGGVTQDIKGIEGGKAYAVKAVCQLRDVPAPYHSLAVQVSWMRGGKMIHPAGMLVQGPIVDGVSARFDDVLVAPEDADGARLSLEVKWLQGGSVLWKEVSVRAAPVPGAAESEGRHGVSAAEEQYAGQESQALVRAGRCGRKARTRYCVPG